MADKEEYLYKINEKEILFIIGDIITLPTDYTASLDDYLDEKEEYDNLKNYTEAKIIDVDTTDDSIKVKVDGRNTWIAMQDFLVFTDPKTREVKPKLSNKDLLGL